MELCSGTGENTLFPSIIYFLVLCTSIKEISILHVECSINFILGKYHCPVTFKVFNQNSHILAVKTTGNVFSYEVGHVMYCFTMTEICLMLKFENILVVWTHILITEWVPRNNYCTITGGISDFRIGCHI